jgi:hypothetical protein
VKESLQHHAISMKYQCVFCYASKMCVLLRQQDMVVRILSCILPQVSRVVDDTVVQNATYVCTIYSTVAAAKQSQELMP